MLCKCYANGCKCMQIHADAEQPEQFSGQWTCPRWCPHQAMTAILFRFCTGYLMVPLAVQSSDCTGHFKDSAQNRDDVWIAVRARLLLLSDASGHREGQLEIHGFPMESKRSTIAHLQVKPRLGRESGRPRGGQGGMLLPSLLPRTAGAAHANPGIAAAKPSKKHKENKSF